MDVPENKDNSWLYWLAGVFFNKRVQGKVHNGVGYEQELRLDTVSEESMKTWFGTIKKNPSRSPKNMKNLFLEAGFKSTINVTVYTDLVDALMKDQQLVAIHMITSEGCFNQVYVDLVDKCGRKIKVAGVELGAQCWAESHETFINTILHVSQLMLLANLRKEKISPSGGKVKLNFPKGGTSLTVVRNGPHTAKE
jgi:hypothetical protein